MADNVNIIVQDTINDIVVNAAVVVETIDINVQASVDVVDIVANPNNYVVNINRIIGEQVQSDWTQTDNQAPDYIKNKPSIPTLTSDLTNDGSDGINPFITAADVPASLLVALPFTTDHLTATNNAYVIGDVVWYLGNVYRCIANNDSILPTSTTYWTNLGAGNPLVAQPSDWNATSGNNQILNKPTIPDAGVTSVGLTMPSAFSVANSPITSAGTLEVTGAGLVSQYVRGDGSLANFPTSTGGGSSLTFYLNGSVSQGTFGGVAFREMDRTPILGAGTDFTISSNGYIQSFITDAGVPNLLEIPAGNWNFETYFSASSNGGSPSFYLELYKWDGTTLSLIASNSANPEGITNGTATHLYLSALPVPQTTLALTDRLAVRIYVNNSGRTIKLHTENGHLCEVITTFSTGLTALNGLTAQVQSFATGTSGTDFGISSATSTHTFNLPTASAANRGALSSTDWTTFNGKFTLPALTSGSVLFSNGTTIAQKNAQLFWDNTNNRLGIGTATPAYKLTVAGTIDAGANVIGNGLWNQGLQGLGGTGETRFVSGTGGGFFFTWVQNNGLERMRLSSNNNLLVGTATDAGFKLDVNGTTRFQGISRFTIGGNNYIDINAGANASTPIIDFFYSGVVARRISIGGDSTGLNALNGFLLSSNGTVANAVPLTAGNINSTGGVASLSGLMYVFGTGDNIVQFAQRGIANRGVLGYAVSTNYFQIRTGGATSLSTGTLSTIFDNVGSVGIGGITSVNASAILQTDSTTKGFLPPRMTTTQKNAIATPAAGLMVYDTTLNLISVYNGTIWISL
jgi:hypothetical protein